MHGVKQFRRSFSFRPYLPPVTIAQHVRPYVHPPREPVSRQHPRASSSTAALLQARLQFRKAMMFNFLILERFKNVCRQLARYPRPTTGHLKVRRASTNALKPAFSHPLFRFGTADVSVSVNQQQCREHARRMQHGKAIDTLAADYEEIFDRDPDFSIYSDDITFEVRGHGPFGIPSNNLSPTHNDFPDPP